MTWLFSYLKYKCPNRCILQSLFQCQMDALWLLVYSFLPPQIPKLNSQFIAQSFGYECLFLELTYFVLFTWFLYLEVSNFFPSSVLLLFVSMLFPTEVSSEHHFAHSVVFTVVIIVKLYGALHSFATSLLSPHVQLSKTGTSCWYFDCLYMKEQKYSLKHTQQNSWESHKKTCTEYQE